MPGPVLALCSLQDTHWSVGVCPGKGTELGKGLEQLREITLHGEDRDQDVSAIESNRCKTQTQRSQTPKAPADIPSRETAEGSLCIQSSFSFSPQCIQDNLHLVEESAVTAVALLLAAWMWEMETCPPHHRP